MAFYDEDAMLFGAVDELEDGRGAIRVYFGKREPEVRVKSYPMPKVRQNKDVAITACHVNFRSGAISGRLGTDKLGVVDAKIEGRMVIH